VVVVELDQIHSDTTTLKTSHWQNNPSEEQPNNASAGCEESDQQQKCQSG